MLLHKNTSERLKLASNDLMEWFSKNKIKVSSVKFHLLTSSNDELVQILCRYVINSTKCEKLLRNNYKLDFNIYVNNTSNNAGQKIPALCRINSFMNLPKRQFLNECSFHSLVRQFFFSLEVPHILIIIVYNNCIFSRLRK